MKDHLKNVTNGQPKVMQLPPMNNHLQWVIIIIFNADKDFLYSLHILDYGGSEKSESHTENSHW